MYGLKNVRSRRDDALSRVGWDRLEVLMADYYRGQGYEVEHVGTGSGSRFDGGIDLKLRKDGQYLVVQCKHWNAKQVPHNAVHELLGIMVNEGATGAILATSGEFTRYASESAAKSGHVQLIDGDGLRAMLGPFPETAEPPETHPETAIAYSVGDRLLRATEGRIRYGGRGRSTTRRAAEVALTGLLLKIGLFLFLAWFIVVVLGGALKHALDSLGHVQSHTATANPSNRASLVQTPRRTSAGNSRAPASGRGPELIDWQSGTTIENRPDLPPPHRPTAAEIRESQRKADEAAAILAPNTPEM